MADWELRTQIFARFEPWRRNVDILYVLEETGKPRMVAKPVEFVAVEHEHLATEPTMTFGLDVAQQLIDELWRCGLRPTEGSGSAGSLAATERHLADMRALVFKTEPK